MGLMIIKRDIPETFRGIVSREVTTTKELLDDIEKRFVKNDKAETSTLLRELGFNKVQGSRKYKGVHHADV